MRTIRNSVFCLAAAVFCTNAAAGGEDAVRYRADGSILERVAVTYDLWNTGSGRKIFLSAMHAPESALHFR